MIYRRYIITLKRVMCKRKFDFDHSYLCWGSVWESIDSNNELMNIIEKRLEHHIST